MNYVYSTISTSVNYPIYAQSHSKDLSVIVKDIVIKGGAGVADRHCLTPKGFVTEVSDEDLEHLEKNATFLKHKQAGFIYVEKKSISITKAVSNMNPRDNSSPKVPEDYEPAKAPKVSKGSR